MKIKLLNKKNKPKIIKGIWFYGLSGSGKTYSSKILKKLFPNHFLIDGDEVRKHISFDLDYDLKSRKIQLSRLLGLSEIAISNNTFPITSSVLMTKKIFNKLKKKKILLVKIYREYSQIKKTKVNSLKKNVVGKDILYEKIDSFVLKNSGERSFKKKLTDIFFDV